MRTTITEICLDIDDVLNCCTMAALKHVGCPVDPLDDSVFNPAWGWNITKAANALHTTKIFTPSSFWKSIPREFWATIPKSKEFWALLDASEKLVGPENICLLSTPTLDPDCLAGKVDWIKSSLPSYLQRQYLIGPRKHFCARSTTLLIDDRDKNVDEFREAGGHAILMPRPWNTHHHIRDPWQLIDFCFHMLSAK